MNRENVVLRVRLLETPFRVLIGSINNLKAVTTHSYYTLDLPITPPVSLHRLTHKVFYFTQYIFIGRPFVFSVLLVSIRSFSLRLT
jgi:hypothetical protein